MKVRVFPGDQQGVGHYRLIYPAHASGLDVDISFSGRNLIERKVLPADQHRPARVRLRPGAEADADVIVLQRPSRLEVVAMIPVFQARGSAVVVDVDDDLSSVHARNIASTGEEQHDAVLRACEAADMVTVSTPQLARIYGRHGRVRVLPNCVPERLLKMPRMSDGRTVGWAGWVGTHPEDLQATGDAVPRALRETGAHYLQVGPADGVREALGLDAEPQATGPLHMERYYGALGHLDVGICPLEQSRFNLSKSRLKPLEMTARRAAVVMSPRPDYQAVHRSGVGVLAKEWPDDWRKQIVRLVKDPQWRSEVVERGMASVRDHHTYEGQGWRWAECWSDAFENRNGRAIAA